MNLKRLFLCPILPTVLAIYLPTICYGNSAPPPAVIIIVSSPPKDLVLDIDSTGYKLKIIERPFQKYYIFYFGWNSSKHETLNVSTANTTFAISLPLQHAYEATYRLDLKNRQLLAGTPNISPYFFVTLTTILTLMIEGIIFYLFKFRKISSWITFVTINLITQGFLYYELGTTFYPALTNVFYGLLIFELLIFIIELVVFLIVLNIFKEHSSRRIVAYVLSANSASFLIGAILVPLLIWFGSKLTG
jgi:hypothetical protein